MRKKKLLIKTIRENEIKWVHLSYIPEEVYTDFFRVTGCETTDFGAYLSKWVKEDFKVNMSMSTYTDLIRLKELVQKRYEYEYAELYSGDNGKLLRISGWIKKWLCYHMRMEVLLNGQQT